MLSLRSVYFSKTNELQNRHMQQKGSFSSDILSGTLALLGVSALFCLNKGRLGAARVLAQPLFRRVVPVSLKSALPLSLLLLPNKSLPIAYNAPTHSAGPSELVDSAKYELYEEVSKWVADVYNYESAKRSVELIKDALYQFRKWECIDGKWQLKAEKAKEEKVPSVDDLLKGISAESFMDFMDFSYAKLSEKDYLLKEHLINYRQLNHLYYFSGNESYRIYKITMITRLFTQFRQCEELARRTDLLIQNAALKA